MAKPNKRRPIHSLEWCLEVQQRVLTETRYALTLNETQEFWEWRSGLVSAWWLVTDYDVPEETLTELVEEWLDGADAQEASE